MRALTCCGLDFDSLAQTLLCRRNVTLAVTSISRPSSQSAQSCKVGIGVVGDGAGVSPLMTLRLANAVPPLAPSTEVIAPVVLFFVPAVVPVTFTMKLHEAPPASVALVKLMLPDPAPAVIVPPPHEPVRPFGVATTRPAGSVSLKPTPESAVAAFGLISVNVSVVVAFRAMLPHRRPWRSSAAPPPPPPAPP